MMMEHTDKKTSYKVRGMHDELEVKMGKPCIIIMRPNLRNFGLNIYYDVCIFVLVPAKFTSKTIKVLTNKIHRVHVF